MISQGVVNPSDEHTKIPGLWKKLGLLYNLPLLDEREDSIMNSLPDENGEVVETYGPFSLPEDEYGDLMFAKRLDPNGSASPELEFSRRESTIADTDEPGSSPAPGRRFGRNIRPPARGSRASKLQQEIDSSRPTSKTASVHEDEAIEDAGDEDEVDSDGGDEESQENEDAGQDSAARRKKVTRKAGASKVVKRTATSRRSARKK